MSSLSTVEGAIHSSMQERTFLIMFIKFIFQAGYEAGSQGTSLPAEFMNGLDNELVPLVHGQLSSNASYELVFHVLDL